MINFLQDWFISLFSPWIPIMGKINEKIKYRVITLCFIADLILFCIVRYVLHKESYFYNTTGGIILMLIIAIFSLDRSLERIHWRRSMWIAWFGMCIAFTVSDIIVPKKVCGLGVILAFVFTGVFFVWQNHTRKDLLWKCFKDAVKISFWLMVMVSFLFRPLYEGGRYAGIFTNPNTFALYLCTIFAVYMSDLDWEVETGKHLKKCYMTYISLALVVFYLALSQARTSMIAMGAVFITWIVMRIIISKKNHNFKPFLKAIAVFLIACVVLYPVFFQTLRVLPTWVNHPIVFKGEALYLANGSKIQDLGEVVVAEPDVKEPGKTPNVSGVVETKKEEQPEPKNALDRFFYVLEHTKGLNALTSGRIDLYKAYAEKLNYAGHKNVSLVIDGRKKAHAHNNWLQFGYTYGIFGMLFYAIITVLVLGFSIKFYWKRRRKNATYAFMIVAIMVGFLVATIAECLFLPFEVFPAFAFWFACEDLFIKKAPKNKFIQNLENNNLKYES
ncbi:MAG: hypothetical protein J5972_06175 [Eubacterium sp.]|nr:hypothetical protein [Eubacterium sp.]